jgi:hypothetical protein
VQRLEAEPAEEASDALALAGAGVGGAVVDVHGDDEDGDVGDEEDRDEPRHPLPLALVLRVQRRRHLAGLLLHTALLQVAARRHSVLVSGAVVDELRSPLGTEIGVCLGWVGEGCSADRGGVMSSAAEGEWGEVVD